MSIIAIAVTVLVLIYFFMSSSSSAGGSPFGDALKAGDIEGVPLVAPRKVPFWFGCRR
ncbi:MAG: hypothetical protein R8M38_00250 [Mariprofundaceae bacterium]